MMKRCSGPWCQRTGGRQINSEHTLRLRALVIDYPANCSCPLSICHIHISHSAATCGTPLVETCTACTSLPIAYHNLLPGTSRETRGQNVFLSHGNVRCAEDLNVLYAGSIWVCHELFQCRKRGTAKKENINQTFNKYKFFSISFTTKHYCGGKEVGGK